MANSLTRTAALKIGPVVFGTLLKHYFDRVRNERARDGPAITQLRQDELLYDEAFNIVKRFFEVSTHHSVEEVQAFSNTRMPTPPWVHAVRIMVPMSCCDEAAMLIIQALGGEEHVTRLVGGTKWWQVRGITGVTGEWVTTKKDWEEAKKRRKAFEKKKEGKAASPPLQRPAEVPPSSSEQSNVYDEDMDESRCILYAHGGGYYFGSVDQERYSIQRHARKINGRVFAINYRLAPQYPFPCALQDLVAAYLYLIKPPPDASHQAVKPAHIVVAGDSAGGGLTLAFLQILRDTGQPLPAGGILVSPWCDLTHAFPSIHTNTATDVIPLHGLSLQKPSVLWPPPSEEMTRKVHTGLHRRLRQLVHLNIKGDDAPETASQLNLTQDALTGSKLNLSGDDRKSVSSDMPVDVGATVSLPSVDKKEHQVICLETKSGEKVTIDSQIHLYTQNSLIAHPLVSPALSYLGGLPPLFFIASDKEVLRDEVIYSAHKAADPSQFPLTDEARALYPPLVGIEERHAKTPVHLQVYDDTAHVLPVLFPFTTPGKYCYRAIATFTKHVTGMLQPLKPTTSSSPELLATTSRSMVSSPTSEEPLGDTLNHQLPHAFSTTELLSRAQDNPDTSQSSLSTPGPAQSASSTRPPISRPIFFSFRMKSSITRSSSASSLRQAGGSSQDGPKVGSRGVRKRSLSVSDATGVCYAGEASVYYNEEGLASWKDGMIRERVSTRGVIRPLEPAEQLDALRVPPEIIGVLSERAVRRYLEGKALFDKKYAKEMLTVEKHRNRNIDLAKKDISKNLVHLQELHKGKGKGKGKETPRSFGDGLESPTGNWGWALADERPPPSSIVSRRDTDEARRLARIADQAVLHDEAPISGNTLWATIVNSLTMSPETERHVSHYKSTNSAAEQIPLKKSKSMFASLRSRR
ncbi:alpha/beta-hydrolase [Paxillus ammoniavirescens]|nr:alpha/beta-hydrolase [Paxillus ammoniavirescens]